MKIPDPKALSSIRGLIFDLDGTLVDSRLDFTSIRRELACPDGVGVLEYIASLPEQARQAAEQIVLEHERRGAERAEWMPGARDCLQYCERRNLPTAILTRNAQEPAMLEQWQNSPFTDLCLLCVRPYWWRWRGHTACRLRLG